MKLDRIYREVLLKYPVLSLLAVGAGLLFWQLGAYPELIFDEVHYVAASEQWISGVITSNLEHPPLGKIVLALGIKLFGSNALGWRVFPVIAGLISLLAGFNWVKRRTQSVELAWLFSMSLMFNFVWYVQSRTAMLDIFGLTFLMLYWSVENEDLEAATFREICMMGVMSGLAFAFKWSYGLFALLSMWTHIFFRKGYSRALMVQLMKVGVICYVVYVATFVPYLFVKTPESLSFLDLFGKFQLQMLELQRSVGGTHPYQSTPSQWILPSRPIWYSYKDLAEGFAQGIFFAINPIVTLAFTFLVLAFLRKSVNSDLKFDRQLLKSLIYFVFAFLLWVLIPRQISFYYYFLPNLIWMQFLIILMIKQNLTTLRSIVFLEIFVFILYYPILSGHPFYTEAFKYWMLLKSWI